MSADAQLAAFKEGARATWGAGDWPSFAKLVWEVGERLVNRVGVGEGDEVLDVGCGTGNAAIRAAQAGAHAVGADLVPEHFDAGRELAAENGVEVEFVEGDAEALPFDEQSFDVVLSIFGHMFAPRHAVAATELARVVRPDGRLGLCTWTPEGLVGTFFRTVGGHMPPPPDFVDPPPLWGDEGHVRELLEPHGFELTFERETVGFRFDSAEDAVEAYETKFGPIVMAREALEPQGKWEGLRNDLRGLFEDEGAPEDGGIVITREYLITLGRKGGQR